MACSLRSIYLAGIAMGALLAAQTALAQDATFAGPGAELSTGANWLGNGGATPTGTGFFPAIGAPTAVTLSGADLTLGGLTTLAGAPNTSIAISNDQRLFLNGAGITTQGGGLKINISADRRSGLWFQNAASAGSATLVNFYDIVFSNTSTAATATIHNAASPSVSITTFRDNSTAGNATIINDASSIINIRNNASAANATITNDGGLIFASQATAGAAIITTTAGANAIPGSPLLAAGTAVGGGAFFSDAASGGTSRHILGPLGLLDITFHDTGVTIGSLEGSGVAAIGGKTLTIGSNGLSTTFSGVIQDLGWRVGSGALAGNLAVIGGALNLTGTNTYMGATTVNGGTLSVNGSIASSSGVTVNAGGTLGGSGTVPDVVVNAGGNLSPRQFAGHDHGQRQSDACCWCRHDD